MFLRGIVLHLDARAVNRFRGCVAFSFLVVVYSDGKNKHTRNLPSNQKMSAAVEPIFFQRSFLSPPLSRQTSLYLQCSAVPPVSSFKVYKKGTFKGALNPLLMKTFELCLCICQSLNDRVDPYLKKDGQTKEGRIASL